MKLNNLSNRLARGVDLNTEIQPLQSLVEIFGNQRVLIEYHHGIREYTNESIVVCAQYGKICVQGKSLHIVLMTKDRLVIQGKIQNVAINKEG